MSKKFSVSSTPTAATPSYDAGDPSIKAKGFQMTETSEGVELHEPDRKYSFRKVSTDSASEYQFWSFVYRLHRFRDKVLNSQVYKA